MIERLFIKNYAIIEQLELEFTKGFHVFTGETGAGKSIIIGALGLLLGEKGDATVIRTGEERAIVEGEFAVSSPAVQAKMRELQIELSDTLIIRRELVQGGKNRVFLNGLQEPLAKLEELGSYLVDIHGQHDHQLLLNQKVHQDILDQYGQLSADRLAVGALFHKLQKLLAEKKELEQDEKKLVEEKIFWETASKEIEDAELEDGEETDLYDSIRRMENAERITLSMTEAYDILYEREKSVTGSLAKAVHSLHDLAGIDQRYEELLTILEDIQAKADTAAELARQYRHELDFDQNTMETAMDRLELIKDYKRKYHKTTIDELKVYAAECREKLARFENRAEELNRLDTALQTTRTELKDTAFALSGKRQTVARDLSGKVKQELAFLGMDKAEFLSDIKYVKDEESPVILNGVGVKVTETGIDRVEFMISSNPGEEPKPLKKVASGGEISRIMLALKTLFASTDGIDTLVFDEIDVGIGGLTANNVAQKMKEIARARQLIVITHLPQIASRADRHFTISKAARDGKTFTSVTEITGSQRTEEVARMLGGESAAGLKHAQEMLSK